MTAHASDGSHSAGRTKGGPLCVGVVGGESTGKSSLAADLAVRTGALVVSEVLREFVERTGRTPTRDEQASILREQAERIDTARADAVRRGVGVVVSDPAPLMTAVYSLVYFGDDSLLPLAITHGDHAFDLLLWCRPDLPWVADPGQRDGPHARLRVDECLATVLPRTTVPVVAVTGMGDTRVDAACTAIADAVRRLA